MARKFPLIDESNLSPQRDGAVVIDDLIPFYGRFDAVTIVDDQMDALAPIRDRLKSIVNIGAPFECVGKMDIDDVFAEYREATKMLHLRGAVSLMFPRNVIGREVSFAARVSPYPIYRRRKR